MARLRAPAGVQVRYRLGIVKCAVLLAIAGLTDVVQFLLSLTGIGEVAAEAIGLGVDVLLPFLAWVMGVKYNARTLGTVLAASAVELAPIVNDAPAYTIEVIMLILFTRSEDIERAVRRQAAEKSDQEIQNRTALIAREAQRRAAAVQAANDNAAQEEREAA